MEGKLDDKKAELIRKHTEVRGSAPPTDIQKMIEWDPDFFERYNEFSAHPWKNGVLPPKIKEFILIALDASVTHMFGPGLRAHTRRALELGATKEELLEIFELVSLIGIHGTTLGISILDEEYRKWASEPKR